MSIQLFTDMSYEVSSLITKRYTTSFSLATSVLPAEMQKAIYAIYGFVRIADEIVDSFHAYDKLFLLNKFQDDVEYALEHGISTHPVLVAFADTVKKFNIPKEYILSFLKSMRADIEKTHYSTAEELKNYVYGSADVVGLMCLKVFCDGRNDLFEQLKQPAQKLGSAFQKVNFLRDLQNDTHTLGRMYFPELLHIEFNATTKKQIEQSIEEEFSEAWEGIRRLPGRAKLAVALAYFYYTGLLKKIRKASPEEIKSKRIRISDFQKYLILVRTVILYKLGML